MWNKNEKKITRAGTKKKLPEKPTGKKYLNL